MKLNNKSVVTMSGEEYNKIQEDFDKLREAYENLAVKVKNHHLLVEEATKLRKALVVEKLTSKGLADKIVGLELYKTAWEARDIPESKIVINYEGHLGLCCEIGLGSTPFTRYI